MEENNSINEDKEKYEIQTFESFDDLGLNEDLLREFYSCWF